MELKNNTIYMHITNVYLVFKKFPVLCIIKALSVVKSKFTAVSK